jgi:hypothetical protein
LFQGSLIPPFFVPAEQISSKKDYRHYRHGLNEEFNLGDDKIDVGLEAFEKLVECLKQFPKYDLNKHLEIMYTKDITVFKYYIKFGVNFVETYPYDCESEPDSNK